MKMHSFFFLGVMIWSILPSIAEGQFQAHPHAQLYLGYAPYKMSESKYTLITGGELDTSPQKSLIIVDQKKTDNAVTFGGRFGVLIFDGDFPFRWNFDLEGELNVFTSSFNSARFGISFEPEFKRDAPIAPYFGIGLSGYTIWGDIGEVGKSDPNDLFLSAPDGHNYPTGSKISITSNFLFGVSTYLGMRIYTGEFNHIFLSGGYQIAAEASKWNYHIIDSNDSDQRYEIPRSILPQHPRPVNQDGFFFRGGFSFTP